MADFEPHPRTPGLCEHDRAQARACLIGSLAVKVSALARRITAQRAAQLLAFPVSLEPRDPWPLQGRGTRLSPAIVVCQFNQGVGVIGAK